MTRVLPDIVPSGMQDTTTLRVAARTHGDCAFLFFNNYLRHYPLPEKQGVQAILKLPSETIRCRVSRSTWRRSRPLSGR